MFVITVRFIVKAGYGQAFLRRVSQQASESLDREAGCRQFDVCHHETDLGRVFLYEVYDDVAAFAEHLRTSHFVAFEADTRAWIDEKIADRWARVASARRASSRPPGSA